MNRTTTRRLAVRCDDVPDFYPSSDGEPMAETGIHVMTILLLYQALEDFFRKKPDVYFAANQYWYWEEGNPKSRRSPNVMVVPGIGNRLRDSLMSWREGGAVPAIVFEITSRGTWKEDLHDKLSIYERLGVREYFIFDPIDRCINPRLQGFRLHRKKYRRIRPSADKSLASQFGFHVRTDRTALRLIDDATGEPILTRAEQVEQAELAVEEATALNESERARVEEQRTRADELGARADEERARAEEERARAEEERARAEEERARADRLQAELDRLKRQISEQKRNGT